MLNQTRPDPVRSPLLERIKGVRHGYFTRIGGVSGGIYQGLNIGTGSSDDQTVVAENRRRVADWMGVAADHLLTAHQVHSPDVVIAREPFSTPRPKADAIVTDRSANVAAGPLQHVDRSGHLRDFDFNFVEVFVLGETEATAENRNHCNATRDAHQGSPRRRSGNCKSGFSSWVSIVGRGVNRRSRKPRPMARRRPGMPCLSRDFPDACDL